MRHFLVIGTAKPLIIQLLLALRAHYDTQCMVICGKGTRFMWLSSLCAEYKEMDFEGIDDDAFVAHVNRLAEFSPEYVLIPADCSGIRMINRVRDRLCLSIAAAPDAAAMERLDNKWHFYQLCKGLELNVPETHIFKNKHELNFSAVARLLTLPFVVKPLNEDASRGTYIIHRESDYRRLIVENPSYQYAPLIAQRFVEGDDVGLNFCAIRGKVAVIAMQRRIDPTHDGSKIQFFFNSYLVEVAHALAKATNYTGVMNVDARIQKDTGEVFLFESNPRFWRSLSASVWCGLNFAAECLEPTSQSKEVRILKGGTADTYYHPLFQPSLWGQFLDRNHQGRMARIMAGDLLILLASAKILCRRNLDIILRSFPFSGHRRHR